MKKILYPLLAISILLVFGCEKQNENPALDQRLIGEWEFVKSVGGFTGKDVILPTANTKTALIFSNYHTYKIDLNGNTVEEGEYKLIKVNSIFTGREDNAINFISSSREEVKLISIQNDSLWLSENHVEPYGSLYIRVKMP